MTAPARPATGRRAPAPARRPRRSLPVLTGLAVLVAVWLGLGAPSVSPVAPPLPASAPAPDVAQAGDLDGGGQQAGTTQRRGRGRR